MRKIDVGSQVRKRGGVCKMKLEEEEGRKGRKGEGFGRGRK